MKMILSRKQISGLLLLTFLASMIFGAVLTSGMNMHDGIMMPCPFMGVPSLCNMSPLDHASAWQQMFAATVQLFGDLVLLLLFSFLLTPAFSYLLLKLKPPPVNLIFRYRYRERIVDPLKLAFASGIINPKIYS